MTSKHARDSVFDHLRLAEVAAPSTPASGSGILYVKSDGRVYEKDDGGTEHAVAYLSDVTGAGDLQDLGDVSPTATDDATTGDVLTFDGSEWAPAAPSGGSSADGASVTKSTQSISDSTLTTILFDTEDYDDSAYHSLVTNTGRLTIPATGRYGVGAFGQWSASSGGTERFFAIQLNGASGAGNAIAGMEIPPPAGPTIMETAYIERSFSSGDYLTVEVYHDRGSALSINRVRFFIRRIS